MAVCVVCLIVSGCVFVVPSISQLYHNTHLGKSACYSKPRFDSTEFIVLHFAGEVSVEWVADSGRLLLSCTRVREAYLRP